METATTVKIDEPQQQVIRDLPVPRGRPSLVAKFAAKYNIDADKLLGILKATAFKQGKGKPEVTNEQMAALLIVADQYGLNPFTREIFAFPDKQNGIVPVVSVDGWARIINEHLMMDGLEFRYSEEKIKPGDARVPDLKFEGHEWMEAVFYRKDRKYPIVIREYLEEVYRKAFEFDDGNKKEGAWQSHTKRFHRHKTLIQGGRIAFGFAGLFDEDEAHRIVEGQVLQTDPLPVDRRLGAAGLKDALGVAETTSATTNTETNTSANGDAAAGTRPDGTVEKRDELVKAFAACADMDALDLQGDLVRGFTWTTADQAVLNDAYNKRRDELAV